MHLKYEERSVFSCRFKTNWLNCELKAVHSLSSLYLKVQVRTRQWRGSRKCIRSFFLMTSEVQLFTKLLVKCVLTSSFTFRIFEIEDWMAHCLYYVLSWQQGLPCITSHGLPWAGAARKTRCPPGAGDVAPAGWVGGSEVTGWCMRSLSLLPSSGAPQRRANNSRCVLPSDTISAQGVITLAW